jgi:hypothetical protein
LFPRTYPHSGLEAGAEFGTVRHGITRYRITATVRTAREAEPDGPLAWYERVAVTGLPLTGMAKKALPLAQDRAAGRPRSR